MAKKGLLAWLMVAIVLFGVLGIAAYRFIEEVGQQASNIDGQAKELVNLPSEQTASEAEVLYVANSQVSGSFNHPLFPSHQSSPSNGEDVVIQAGDVSWDGQAYSVRVQLNNQSGFDVGSVWVSLLVSDGQTSRPLVRQIELDKALLRFESQILELDIDWQEGKAEKISVIAQVVSVSDAGNEPTDYPQISPAVSLKQRFETQNTLNLEEVNPHLQNEWQERTPPKDYDDEVELEPEWEEKPKGDKES